ncbi:MAG: type II toxin-antitoxin system RelE/ParE family toxin [Oscillospiraceae bacterium]|nr:type II toxin-antitoxin system RelE/ParE family toxin [Oscillospiraceae bacterium]
MSYHIHITGPAKEDMRDIYAYIAYELNSPAAARNRIVAIKQAIAQLKHGSSSAFVRDDYLSTKGYRMLVARSHLIFYVVHEQTREVFIRRVMYGRRDWQRLLKEEES